MKNNNFYVYKLYSKIDELLYIGKTEDLNRRMKQHSKDKYWWIEVENIYYTKCDTKTDMDIYEIYYINTLNPKYNKATVNNDAASFVLKELEFQKIKNTYTKHNREDKYIKYKPNRSIQKFKDVAFNKKVIYVDEKIFELDPEELLLLSILNDEFSRNGVMIEHIMPYLHHNENYFLEEFEVLYYLQSLIFKGYIKFIEVEDECIYFCNELKNGGFINCRAINWLISGEIDFLEWITIYKMKYLIKSHNGKMNSEDMYNALNLPNCIYNSMLKKFEDMFIMYSDDNNITFKFSI